MKFMKPPYKLVHRLWSILFVPTIMVILAGVVKCSHPLNHDAHEPLKVADQTSPESKSPGPFRTTFH